MNQLYIIFQMLAILLSIVVPIGITIYYMKKYKLDLIIAGFGALFFIAIQIIHIPILVFTQEIVYNFILSSFGMDIAILGISIYIAILAGLFEEVGRYIVFIKLLKPKQRTIENAKLFGAGWGGIESIIVMGILGSLMFLGYYTIFDMGLDNYHQILIDQGVTEQEANEQIDYMRIQEQTIESQPYLALLGFVERAIAIVFHILASILVMYAIIKKDLRYLGIAILAHFILDFTVVYSMLYLGILAEVLILIFVILLGYYVNKKLKISLK